MKSFRTLLAPAREFLRRLRSRPRLGLFLCPTGSSVVEVARDGRVLWEIVSEEPVSATTPPDTVSALLSRARETTRTWYKPVLVIGLDPAFAQYKRLWRFPTTNDAYVDSMVVRENAIQFFRSFPSGTLISEAVRDDAGLVWAAAYDESLVRAVCAAASLSGFTLRGVVPQESLPVEDLPPEQLAHPLSSAACRSAILGWSRGQIRFGVSVSPRPSLRPGFVSRRVAAGALVVALIVVGAWPILAAQRLIIKAQRSRAALQANERIAREIEVELDSVGRRLARLAISGAPRFRSLDLLEHLAAALPSGAVVTRVSLDSAGGRIDILSPAEDDLGARLARSSLVESPELVGPVEIDRASGREMFRYSLRFVHGGAARGESP